MTRFLLCLALVIVGLGLASNADARTSVSMYFSSGGYYDPYWDPYPRYHRHRRYFHPRFVHGPPVVVAPAPVILSPPPVTYAAPLMQDGAIPANQTSSTFVDESGRTCRMYETVRMFDGYAENVNGKACLFPDGAWRVVE